MKSKMRDNEHMSSLRNLPRVVQRAAVRGLHQDDGLGRQRGSGLNEPDRELSSARRAVHTRSNRLSSPCSQPIPCSRYFWSVPLCLWVIVLNLSHHNKFTVLSPSQGTQPTCCHSDDFLSLRHPPRLPPLSHADGSGDAHACLEAPGVPGLRVGTQGAPGLTPHTPQLAGHLSQTACTLPFGREGTRSQNNKRSSTY